MSSSFSPEYPPNDKLKTIASSFGFRKQYNETLFDSLAPYSSATTLPDRIRDVEKSNIFSPSFFPLSPLFVNLISIFTGGVTGAIYASSPVSLLNQLSTGTTPVTAVTQPVGLVLDSRLGLAPSTKGVYLSGAAGAYLSSPDSISASITGSIDLQVYVSLDDWTPVAENMIIDKSTYGSNQGSFSFYVNSLAGLSLELSPNGTGGATVTSSSSVATGFANGTANWVRATWNQTTKDVIFYTSSNGVSWVQLGTTRTTNIASIFDSPRDVQLGGRDGVILLSGKLYQARIYNGINGTLALEFKGTDYITGSTLTSSTTGEVWTLNGAAYIAPDGNHALQATAAARPTWEVDAGGKNYLELLGIDDSLTSATGGGGSAGFFWCGAVELSGGAGTYRHIANDLGSGNNGYSASISDTNKLTLIAGNGVAYTFNQSTATVDVGTTYLLTTWDDGTNLNVQINNAAVETVARPVVVAGAAGFTVGKNNSASSQYLIGKLYASVYVKNSGLTATQRAAVQAWVKSKAGL